MHMTKISFKLSNFSQKKKCIFHGTSIDAREEASILVYIFVVNVVIFFEVILYFLSYYFGFSIMPGSYYFLTCE